MHHACVGRNTRLTVSIRSVMFSAAWEERSRSRYECHYAGVQIKAAIGGALVV